MSLSPAAKKLISVELGTPDTKTRILDTAEELFQAVLTRRLDPMNQERMQLLGQFERSTGPGSDAPALTCENILSAMCIPALRLARDHERGGKNFLRLLGRAYADPAPFIRHFLSLQYADMIGRFRTAFAHALPHLSRDELSWRLHFVMGALSYTLAGTDALRMIAHYQPEDADNDELLLSRLAPFLAAGLLAPVTVTGEVHHLFSETG